MRNSLVALILQFLAMLAGFFSRKIIIDFLGTEVVGLNTTAASILGGLNLVESGIWSAIAVTLYKPLFEGDKQAVREIVALHGWLYRIVAAIVMAGSVVVMVFFPLIFAKSELPLWYPYAAFGVLLYSSMLTLLVNYNRNALYADQQSYKVLLCARLIALVKLICQAFAVYYFSDGFIWWVVLEAVFATLGAFITRIVVYKSFPYLREKVSHPASLRFKYPEVLGKVKYLFFHKVGAYAVTQTSPLIIYGFASLSMVAMYGNYQILVTNLFSFMAALFSGLEASIGNLVAEGDRKLKMKVFGELLSSRMLIISVTALCLWLLADPLISVWLGPEFVMGKTTLLLIVMGFCVGSSRGIVQCFVDAHGDYSDIWAPLAEFVLNVGLSILGGRLWGLDGILGGAMFSQIIIGLIWKPFFLFRKVMKESLGPFVFLVGKYLFLIGIAAFAVLSLFPHMHLHPSTSIWTFLLDAVIVLLLCIVCMGVLFYAFDTNARGFVNRIIKTFSTK